MKRTVIITIVLAAILSIPLMAQEDAQYANQWWNERVFYEIFVRSFYDSDGDGIGDIQGIIEKLDYLNDGDPATTDDLGITGIWLMPVNPSPSYHGYDVTDYRDINPDYGTMADFQMLLDEAHARGIAVIIDLVLNHSSVQHPWFIQSTDPESEFADWYIWSGEDPGYSGPWGQEVWHKAVGRYYYGVFWSGMPDLNYENPDVTAEMYDVSRFWLEDVGVDGFRLDAVKHFVEEGERQEGTPSTLAWLAEYHDYVESVKPDALLLAEIWNSTNLVADYMRQGSADIAFEFDLAEDIRQAAGVGISSALITQLGNLQEAYPPGQYATFLTNHDQNRLMSQFRGDVENTKAAAALLLTLPGVPFIYYGEEIGMQGVKPDEDIRRPMQWSAEPQAGFTSGDPWRAPYNDYETTNVAMQSGDPDSLLSTYRDLIHVRSSSPALQKGDLTLVESDHRKVVAFLRQSEGETVLVMINLDDEPVTEYTLSLGASSMKDASGVALLLGTGEASAPLLNPDGGFLDYVPVAELSAKSATIIRLEGNG